MANNKVQVSLAFTADTKQAKQQIDQLQASLTKLTTFSGYDLKFGDNFKKEVVEASQSLAQLQTALHSAINQDTGKIDLSKFNASMKSANMTINDYVRAFKQMGPEGEKAFEQFSYAIQGAEIPLRRTGKLANELWTTLKNTMRWQLSASVIQGFTGAVQKAYGYAQDLNESLNNIRIVTNASVEDMARFAIEANKSAKALSTTTTEYTNASLIYYQQGLTDAEVKERTDVTIKMANVARESAETISDQMTAVWNNFDDGSKSLEYYADVMTALGAATASSTAEITTGLEKFAAVAETVGLSYEYATTALATITDTTRQSADIVGNALKTLFARIQGLSLGETLEDGTDLTKYSEALAKVGISIKEQDGSLKEMDTILDEMANRWGTLAKDQQVALAQTVAGVRQYTQLVALMDNWDKFQKNLSVAQNAEGTLQKQADIYAEGWEAARERVQASLEAIYHDLLNDEFFIDLNDGLAKTIGLLDQVIDNFGGLKGIVAGLGVVFTKVFNKQLVNSISNITFSLKQRVTGGADEIALKNKTATAYQNWTFGVGDEEDNAKKMSQQRIGQLQKDLLEDSKYLTEEAIKQRQIDIDRQKVLDERVIASARELDIQREITGDLRSDMSDMYRYDGSQQERKKANKLLNSTDSTMTDLTILQTFKALPAEVKNSTESLNLFKKVITETFNIDPSVLDNNLNDVDKTIQQLEKRLQNLKQQFVNRATQNLTGFADESSARATLEAHLRNQGMAPDEIEETVRNHLQFIRETRAQMEQEFDNYTNAMGKQFGQQIKTDSEEAAAAQAAAAKRAARNLDEWKQGLVGVMQGVSQVTFGIQSLIAINDVLNNQDLEWHEKTLSIIQSLAFGLPSVVNGLTMLGDSLSKLKNANLANSALVVLSKNSKIAELGLIKVSAAGKATVTSLAGLGKAILGLLGPYALLAAAIVACFLALKAFSENTLEGKLKKSQQQTEELSAALSDAAAKARELKDAFDQYDQATEALESCVVGTEEFTKALQAANTEASNLLALYPELYGFISETGEKAVTYENGQVKIADWARKQYEEQAAKAQFANDIALAYQTAQTNQSSELVDKESLKQQMASLVGKAGFSVNDENLSYVLEQAISKGSFSAVDNRSQSYLALFDELQPTLNELINTINGNTNALEVSSSSATGTMLKEQGYSDAVIKATAKAVTKEVDEKKNELIANKIEFRKNADEYFKEYAKANGLKEDASYNHNTGTYTVDGEEHKLSLENLANWYASYLVDPKKLASDISAAIGNNASYETLINEGTAGLSRAEMAQLDEKTLKELVDFGVITQAVADEINAIPEEVAKSTLLEDTLSANLQQILVNVFGKNWANEYVGDLIKQIPPNMRDEFAQAVAQTDWSDIDSAQAFGDLLSSMGINLPTVAINNFINQMMEANNAVKDFNEADWSENVKETSEILQDLDVGGIISEEDLAHFTELDAGFGEYFTKMADGTYMLTRDAEEFYDLVRNAQLNEVKEAIQSNENEITRLRSEAEKAAQDGKDELADNYNAQADALAEKNPILQFQGLSMARSGEEFDEMAKEDEFKSLDKNSESYQRLRNAIIETEEERGKEVETLGELNKLRNKGEIGNRGYAAGLTKLAKQYPQLNKEVAKYEEAMADYGKDSKEAASALNDLNNAMSAAQWKTAAQDLYDARCEIRELKTEYGSLAAEMEEYQTALQDQADALTALFGVEVSPAFAEAHADLIDEYLAGSQKAGYELMWLAEQQSGHIETVVNEYLASTGASAEQIQNVITALDGLSFDIDGTADMTQVIESLLATGATGEQVAKMLNALGSSHIQFEVSSEGWKTMEELTEEAAKEVAESGFMGGRKKTLELVNNLATQRYKAQLNVTASGTVPKVDEFELSTVSGKNKGGGSKPSTKTYEKDKFHTEKKTVADLEKELERLEKQRDHAFGEDKRSFLDSEIEKAKELQSEYAKYQAAVQAELATAKTEAINVGAQIDPTSGAILNYNALMEQFTQEYNAAMAKAGDNDAAQEAAEKRYDTLVKTLETYYELYDLNEELIDTIYDLDLSVHSKELETISLYVEQVFDVTDDKLKYIDWMMTKIENRAFSTAQQLTQLLQQTEPLLTQGNSLQYAFGEIDEMISQEGWTDEIGELGDETVDNAYSVMEALLNLKNNAMDKVTEGIDEQTSALDQWIARWDNFITIVSNIDDIFGLLGEKFITPEMEAALDKTDSQLALDKLKGTKSDLDYWTSVRDSAKEQRDAFAEGTEEYEKWDKIYRDALIEQEKCQADLTAAWKETLEAITTQYKNSVDRAIAEAERGITGFKNLEEAQKALDQQMKDKELFLEDFERAHELSNLTQDINKAMNDLSNSVAKNNMAKLLDDIAKYEKEGVKMTEYELEVLQKKFEIEQARADLEAAKTAMSQVRLTRDDEGNWSYQYTADQDKIDEATRSFEDKMYELEKLSREHIDETTATILELEQEMFEEIKNLNIKDFKDVDEFNAAKKKIVEAYTTRVEELYGDIGLAIETVNGIYGTEKITFAQTTAGITSGAKSQDEAIQNFKDSTVTASGAITDAAKTYQAQVEETFPAVGTTVEGFSEDYNEYIDGMTEKSKTLVEEVEGMSDKYSTAIDDIMTEVRQWQQEFSDEIDLMIQKLEELILKYNEAKAAKMNVGDGSGPKTTTTEEVPETETEDTQTDNTSSTEAEAANMASDAEELLRRVHTANLGGYKADGSAGGWKNYAKSEGYSEEVISLVSKALNDSKAGGGYSYFYNKAKELLGLASGGYTGEWGPEGRLALLHQKELVLNPQDTENFLAGISILREITRMIDLQANAMASPMGFAMPFASHGGSGLEQNVHISASFPGVQDRNEIEIALRSLVNEASQFVLE